ncbi:hypothetical protein HNS03_12465 [Amorphus sp. 3PC139-8]
MPIVCVAVVASGPVLAQEAASVKVTDATWDTAAGMFAYTEFELSGEPLAEGLGLNLDVLDPDQANKPDPFDFAAGIDSYELSEEAMYAVNYQSGMGPHIANGPVNKARAGSGNVMEALGKRVVGLATAAGQTPDDLPQNFYPISFPLAGGKPEFAAPVDIATQATTPMEILTDTGEQKSIQAVLPAYFRDYASLRWPSDGFQNAFTPQAAGMELLKDVLWAQDYLRQMHKVDGDEPVDATSVDMDKGSDIGLGDVGADGFNGLMLTEISWDKLTMIRDQFAYDGKTLGAKIPDDYDASKTPIWLPNRVSVTLDQQNGVTALADPKVDDGGSSLRTQWVMLWPLAEFYGFSDQRPANTNQKADFLAVFDGDPFPSAPKANLEGDPLGSVAADDPFSLVQLLTRLTTQNLMVLHFDKDAGTLVDTWSDGKAGDTVTTLDAAYTLAALQIYQRAIDALPVGYASATSGKPLGTDEGKAALSLIKTQADFLIDKVKGADGLYADSYTIGTGAGASHSVATQFAVIRGFDAAFLATGDSKYRDAARDAFLAAEAHLFDSALGIYNDEPGKPFEVTPWEAGTVSGGIRVMMLDLVSRTGESNQALTLAHLAERYTAWFRTVGRGMQLAEWLNDTGEHMVATDYDGDINQNGIKSITHAGGAHGRAAVMASKAVVSAAK